MNTSEMLAEALSLKAEIAVATANLKALTDALAESVGNESGKHIVAGVGYFTISENNTYPEAAIRAALTPGQAKRCEVRKISNSLVSTLYPEVYAAAKRNNGVKVSIA